MKTRKTLTLVTALLVGSSLQAHAFEWGDRSSVHGDIAKVFEGKTTTVIYDNMKKEYGKNSGISLTVFMNKDECVSTVNQLEQLAYSKASDVSTRKDYEHGETSYMMYINYGEFSTEKHRVSFNCKYQYNTSNGEYLGNRSYMTISEG
ncbi:hypothetical protein [Enterovibrio norvegicus]|uniref:hypothetical protein n=1 Tax=Enterovibrio norvegicus TaxID=188144 RepID=UPI000C85E299|nr:hypothetical protein [Enterovibrio norvegicus]PMN64315.1 hypothetical protein BCT27_10140 [Enterovibrio norvegicus]